MKLASYRHGGAATYGAVVAGGLVDLGKRLGARAPDLDRLLKAGLVDEARRIAAGAQPDHRVDQVEFLPLNPRLDMRVFALGVAYKDHQLETGRADAALPSMFSKHPQSLVGHNQPMVKPNISNMYDFEGEIVAVIGKPARNVPQERALEYLAGYSILVDGSIRDYQKASVTAGKNFDRSSSYGPWMLTADEVPDWRKLELTTRLNGTPMQHTLFGMLIWPLEFVIHYISTFTRLEPGDAISTGTPAGVGHRRNPQLFMKPGDVLEVEVSGIGVLRNPIVGE